MDLFAKRPSGEDGKITVEFVGHVAFIRLKRGENRLNLDFFDKINKALDEVERNPDAHCLITTGDGRFYSNGLDLEWLAVNLRDNAKLALKFRVQWTNFIQRILTFPMPTVAAINGHAFAGGAILALAHDYRVMRTDKGWLCLNEVHINLFFDNYLMELIKHKVPGGHAVMEAVVMGKRFTAEEGLKSGIVYATSSAGQLLDTAKKVAKKVTPPSGFTRTTIQTMKEHLYTKVLSAKYDQNTDGPPLTLKYSKL